MGTSSTAEQLIGANLCEVLRSYINGDLFISQIYNS